MFKVVVFLTLLASVVSLSDDIIMEDHTTPALR